MAVTKMQLNLSADHRVFDGEIGGRVENIQRISVSPKQHCNYHHLDLL